MKTSDKIFIDSNYLIAFFNPADSLHNEALKIGRQIEESEDILIISNYIFLEITTVLAQRAGKETSLLVGDHCLANPRIAIVHIDELLHEHTWHLFRKIDNKNISFVDCSVIAVMKQCGINKLLTFDQAHFKHFRQHFRFSFYPMA